jgi:hypothetical protein
MPTLDDPANQGSRMKTHLKVVAPLSPSMRLGLSCSRSPLRNQCTVCLSAWGDFLLFSLELFILRRHSFSAAVFSAGPRRSNEDGETHTACNVTRSAVTSPIADWCAPVTWLRRSRCWKQGRSQHPQYPSPHVSNAYLSAPAPTHTTKHSTQTHTFRYNIDLIHTAPLTHNTHYIESCN